MDLAFSSGMQQSQLRASMEDAGAAVAAYEQVKINYKDTAQKCEDAGFTFTPLVFESHGGGFGKSVRSLLGKLASAQTAAGTHTPQGHSLRLAERVSSAHHRASARAILRRLSTELAWEDTPTLALVDPWELI